MFKVNQFCLLVFVGLLLSHNIVQSIVEPVVNFVKKEARGARRETFEAALHLIDQRSVKTIIETGTARGGALAFDGDGAFTVFFGYWSALNGADLYSVDINPYAIQNARYIVSEYEKNVHFIEDDSAHFLQQFHKPIDFLYLDSFDFDSNNPEPSQLHHLHEIEAAYDKLTPNAIVMIDDCGLPHGGKGKLVIDYLLKKGWRTYMESYQVIMVRS